MNSTVGGTPRTYAEFLEQPSIVKVVADMRDCGYVPEPNIKIGCLTTWANKLEITNQLLRERVAELEQKLAAADDFDECEWRLARRQFSNARENVHHESDHRLS